MVGTRSQRVPLKSLTALTLHSSRKTASRRTPPIPQLTCKGKACRTYQPDVVQCVKVGEDGVGGVEWKCEADLPRGVRFGEVEVGCEGWDGPDDPFILRGSCGLTYNLVRSSSALEDSSSYGDAFTRRLPSSFSSALSDPGYLFNSAFNLFFLALSAYLLLSLLRKLLPSRQTLSRFFGGGGGGPGGGNPRGGGGGGGWGGWGGWGGRGNGLSPRPPGPPGPPPPYTPKPDPPQPAEQGWRPGFWTGAAAGWAANAFLGHGGGGARERQQREEMYRAPMGWGNQGGGFWNRDGGLGGFGGFGGGGTPPRQRGGWGIRDWDDDRRGGAAGASGSATGGMRSTGFGGTSVR
ncbi:hypothetical protein JCM6882_002153 [Rhodosporidiobolus microsporus]